ncbi:MAG TPA: acetyl-CoA carboxylase biotin carboxyl carrier protein [bacterium]|nr:acetyl-CoA carboxylase biotin carboxyl carrier protein [bacterium]
MEPEELKKYVDFMKENGLSYLEVRKGDFYLILQTENHIISEASSKKSYIESKTPLSNQENNRSSNFIEIKSPLIGTFYRAPSPHAPPFVEVGSAINSGTTLCIVEAMKVMNEIKSDCSGIIRKILVENGSPVEYGQVLFLIEPVARQET